MNKSIFTCGIFAGLLALNLNAQDTIILQPNSTEGKDAFIWYLSDQNGTFGPSNSTNYGSNEAFIAQEWTWFSNPGRRKSLLEFDLSGIPQGSLIVDARLSLYAFPDSPDGGHQPLSGSNECVLQRVISPWDEDLVTWNTQPAITTEDEVLLSQSAYDSEDYPDIDVTALVQDMVNDPAGSYGFMLSMVTPQYYRAMVFASSDHPDSSRHPKLVIRFRKPSAGLTALSPSEKTLVKIVDLVGRETEPVPNVPLIYIYSDGTRKRVVLVE